MSFKSVSAVKVTQARDQRWGCTDRTLGHLLKRTRVVGPTGEPERGLGTWGWQGICVNVLILTVHGREGALGTNLFSKVPGKSFFVLYLQVVTFLLLFKNFFKEC